MAVSAGVNYPALLTRMDEISPLEPVRAQRLGEVRLPAQERLMSKVMVAWDNAMWKAYDRLMEWSGKRPW